MLYSETSTPSYVTFTTHEVVCHLWNWTWIIEAEANPSTESALDYGAAAHETPVRSAASVPEQAASFLEGCLPEHIGAKRDSLAPVWQQGRVPSSWI